MLFRPASLLAVVIYAVVLTACGGGGGGGSDPAAGAGISLSTNSVAFSAAQGGAMPPSQSIQATISDPNAFFIVTGFPPNDPVPAWLDLALNGAGNNWSVQFSVNTTNLAPGTYAATVRVLIARSDESVIGFVDAQVTYTVATAIVATPGSLNFSHVIGGPTPNSQNVTLAGTSGLNWTASANQPWVGLSATAGATPAIVSVSVNPTGLTAGTHNATVTFSEVGGSGTATVFVTLTVAVPAITATTTSLSFVGVNGAPMSFGGMTIFMNNGTAVDWSAATADGWVVLDKTSGTTPTFVSVSMDPTVGPLADGTHNSTITITGATGGSVVVNVSLTLNPAVLTANPGSITLGGADGSDFSAQSLQLSLNTGANFYNWSASPSDSWIQVSPSSGSVSGSVSGPPVNVAISPDVSGLAAGTHNGSVTFTSNVNGNTITRNVAVTLRLEPHQLFVQDNGVALVSSLTRTKLSHTVTVRDNHGVATPWTAASDQTWLSVTASGTTEDSLALTANPVGLTTETIHFANVVLSSTDATVVNSETIRVGFYVTTVAPSEPAAATLANPNKSTGMVADPVRPYVYVSHGGETIDIYNIYSGALANTITSTGADLRALTISTDGTRLYAADHANLGIFVVDITTDPPTNVTTFTNPIWSNCTGCTNAFTFADLDYTRLNGRPVIVTAGPQVVDALTGARLVGPNVSFFAFAALGEVSGDGDTLFVVNTNSTGHIASRYALRYNVPDNVVTVTSTHSASKSGFARGLSTNYDGSRVYRACWHPNDIEVYDGANLATLSTVPNGTNGGALLGPDNLVYCARYYSELSAPGVPDVWAFDTDAGLPVVGREYNVAGEIAERQFVISGDGLRLITRSNNLTSLTSTTVAP